jgi:hypothetical protein
MIESWRGRRGRLSVRVLLPTVLVGSVVGGFGVAPAMAQDDAAAATTTRADDDGRKDLRNDLRDWLDDRHHGDKRYVWFDVCETTSTDTLTSVGAADTTADTTANVAGTTTETTPGTTTETTPETTAQNLAAATTETVAPAADPAATEDTGKTLSAAFVVVEMDRDEYRELDRSERRGCYDVTTQKLVADTAEDSDDESTTESATADDSGAETSVTTVAPTPVPAG